ncbi:MAG: type II toxin-antitoxin system RelE family toxin [Candidatus Entotheonellia bacterium]
MTPSFSVHTTPHFDRLLHRLSRRHPELVGRYAEAMAILAADPYNRSRGHPIIKLEGVRQGDGQYRLRLGRWRFRYDVFGREVWLFQCGLRREDTY